jgi:hypothetical protein
MCISELFEATAGVGRHLIGSIVKYCFHTKGIAWNCSLLLFICVILCSRFLNLNFKKILHTDCVYFIWIILFAIWRYSQWKRNLDYRKKKKNHYTILKVNNDNIITPPFKDSQCTMIYIVRRKCLSSPIYESNNLAELLNFYAKC